MFFKILPNSKKNNCTGVSFKDTGTGVFCEFCEILNKTSFTETSRQLLQFITSRSSNQKCSMKNGVLRNFTKFTGKLLCQELSFKSNDFSDTKTQKTKYEAGYFYKVCSCKKMCILQEVFLYSHPPISRYSQILFQNFSN